MKMTDKLIYLLLAQNAGQSSDIETQTLPFTFKSNGRRLKNYQIYGNTGGVGDLGSDTNKYVIPVTINGTATNISLDSPLGLDDYIDFKEQKRYNSDNTSEIVLLPAITTVNGINILDVDTTVTPSKIGIQGDIDTAGLIYIDVGDVRYAGRLKVINNKPVFEYYT